MAGKGSSSQKVSHPLSNDIKLGFDIGHSSIGWAVLKSGAKPEDVELLGCGSVIFPKDDCLASARRGHRRMRRNIRATRQRIARLKKLLLHLGILTANELDAPGHPAPHVLAAKALASDKPVTTWQNLWHILRWYAHNRGYDGNSRWARQEDDGDDTEKEKAALKLMQDHGTDTMAATICAQLGIDPRSATISSAEPFKTLNAAFPRKVVRDEILAILHKHKNHLPKLNDAFIDTLVATDETRGHRAWETIPVPEIQLPRRYFGGLLFGQLIPRFDNRIIAKCPISGGKVPNKACLDFLRYRWVMIIANLRANGKPLSVDQRTKLNATMEEKGRLTATELRKTVEKLTGTTNTNVKAYFEIHPDSADALELDPAQAYAHAAQTNKRTALYTYWHHLPESSKHRATGRWKKGRRVTLQWMLDQCALEECDSSPLQDAIDNTLAADKGTHFPTKAHLLSKSFSPKSLSGRAPYARSVLREVVACVPSTDKHPTEEGGPIYRSKDILKAERDRPIDDLTNNHLIRQRLTILLRLLDDIITNYAQSDTLSVTDIVVEVARDLQEYSGLTAKEMAGELTKRLSHFKSAVAYLEKNAPDLPLTGSLIRKCRIAMDMDWKCPFTGKMYDALQLPELEREHIIPYAERPTNSLDSLVLTFDWVNKLKGKRTGLQFINDLAEDKRFFTPKQYETFVAKLKTAKKETYPDDYRRQSNRKRLMMVENYEAKEHGFTAGALTQTSQLNRLSARQLEKRFIDPKTGDCTVRITSIPGQVTAEARKAWRLLHTLVPACPECDGKNKTEIRSITHLHHALDAATLTITHHFLPGILPYQKENEKGAIWQAMLKRQKSKQEQALLLNTGLFTRHYRKDDQGPKTKDLDVHLNDLPDKIKSQLARKLAEKRVVQHIPADQSGAILERNQWRIIMVHGDRAILKQRPNRELIELDKTTTTRKWKDRETSKKEQELLEKCATHLTPREQRLIRRGIVKIRSERLDKLIGLQHGKLANNKAALIISENYGIALQPKPSVVPFHKVFFRLDKLRKLNGGTPPQVLRLGKLFSVKSGNYEGTWMLRSVADGAKGIRIRMTHPQYLEDKQSGVPWAKDNVTFNTLLQHDLEILSPPLTGVGPSD